MRTHVVLGLILCACSTAKLHSPPAAMTEPEKAVDDVASSCPMMVEDAQLAVSDAQGGVALTFTTTGDVDDLRSRVERLAQIHASERGMMPMADAHVRAEDVDHGAQLVFTPDDPEKVEMLRLHIQKMAATMQSGECPMAMK